MSMFYEHKCPGCGEEINTSSPKPHLCYQCEEKKIQTMFPDFKNESARDLMYLATRDVYCKDNAHILQKAARELEALSKQKVS
jgi:hypothetical protein